MDLNKSLNDFLNKIKSLSKQEQIAYGCIVLGVMLILIAAIIW